MTVSIIIATKIWQKNLEECIDRCLQLDYPDFEILILPDVDGVVSFRPSKVPIQIIPTGPVSPAKKRDIALGYAKGEILGFIDDDAYPNKDWLKEAIKNFSDSEVAAVGGPAVTPPSDNLRQKASGSIYASWLVSWRHAIRYVPGKKRLVEDYPSCNFLVRKSILQQLGGFQTNFWPGEDTKLCLDITHKLAKKIIYDPKVIVWHHRRPLFAAHLKQTANYALHRGYFVKRYPQTSRKFVYFVPAIFVFCLIIGGLLSLFFAFFRIVYLSAFFLYLAIVLLFSLSAGPILLPWLFFGTVATHITYGIYFLQGLLSKTLKGGE